MKHTLKLLILVAGILYMCIMGYAQNPRPILQKADTLTREIVKQKAANKERAAKIQFQYFVIKAANQTFGYNVYADGHLYLHQPIIPGVAGNNGFADTATAGRVARLVIRKLRMGEMPPTITQEELKQMMVIIPKRKEE